MQRARVLTLFAGLVIAPFVPTPSQATTAPTASQPLLFGRDLIRPKQPVPDDPLAGLPSDDGRGQGKGAGSGGTRAACAILAVASSDRDIGDLRATLAFVKHGPKAWPCPPRALQAELRLRIGIDGTGKITAAEAVAGNANIASAMTKRLTGKTIGPRTEGPTVGIVVLTFATGRP